MVSKEEIEHVAKLMRIDLDDHTVHIDRVQKMIEYLDILDKAVKEITESLIVNEQPLENLREDKYIRYDVNLIDKLKHYKEKFVRAPKMV
ncbi:MAG: hypothetical protein HYZ56_05195 [Nitrosopumilales archaeon]|nr:hypothetical protein [Nitrosopumilales archaeon]